MVRSFGRHFAQLRQKNTGMGLREFCRRNGYDHGNISRLEQSRALPPQSQEKLKEYATALGLSEDSAEWYEFFDRAAADRGEVPKYLMENADVVEGLPFLFKKLRTEVRFFFNSRRSFGQPE